MFDIKLAKRQDTAAFTFRRLSPSADKPIVMRVRHLGRTNKPYVDAAFKRKVNADKSGYEYLLSERDQDLADIAVFCADSWNVTRDGAPVECTPENVSAFFKYALENGYDDDLIELAAFSKITANFREAVESGADLGKG